MIANLSTQFSLSLPENYLLAVTFTKSRSPNFKHAMMIAKTAKHYREFSENGEVLHLFAYTGAKTDIDHAIALLDLVGGWNTTKVLTKNRSFSRPQLVRNALHCYRRSLDSENKKMFCWTPMEKDFMNPCRLINGHYRLQGVRSIKDLRDRIDASAMRMDLEWCPNFSTEHIVEEKLNS